MENNLYQIHILLKGSKPRIWRRILINANEPLSILHLTIQETMGWFNYHLHQFRKNNHLFMPRMEDDIDYWDEDCMFDYKHMKISDLLTKENEMIIYEYDFGDGWEHEIRLEKLIHTDGPLPFPTCIKGKMACPPEDCGGIWGYYDMLKALKDPEHEMHQEYKDWIDPEFDPEYFSIEETNVQILSLFFN